MTYAIKNMIQKIQSKVTQNNGHNIDESALNDNIKQLQMQIKNVDKISMQ